MDQLHVGAGNSEPQNLNDLRVTFQEECDVMTQQTIGGRNLLITQEHVYAPQERFLHRCKNRCVKTEATSRMPRSSSIAQARRMVHQLRMEARIKRIKVSKASADLMRYCGEQAKNDPLLMGIPASENPFKDKKSCTVL